MRHLIMTGLLAIAIQVTAFGQDTTETKVIRFGIIGTDTSHAVQFAKLLNNPNEKNHVAGGRITHAYKGGSTDIKSSAERVDKFAGQLKDEYGVEFVDSVEELVKNVDAVMLESVDGRPHLEQVKPVFAAKKPVFIDKPLAGTLKDAMEIARLAKESGTPCFSSSSLRFFPGVTEMKSNKKVGEITGVSSYGPCELEPHHPDLYWYGVHGVEILYTLMGDGCDAVTRVNTADYDVAVGTWKDGRIGSYRGFRKGKYSFGALVLGTNGVEHTPPVTDLYSALVQEIVKFASSGVAPVSMETTVEIMAFMEAADESKRQGGKPVKIEDVKAAAIR